MIARLYVNCIALGGGVGLGAGWRWALAGAAAGVALAVYDELHERRERIELVNQRQRGDLG